MKPIKKLPIIAESVYKEILSTGEGYNGYVVGNDGVITYCLSEVTVTAEPANPTVKVNRHSEFYCFAETVYRMKHVTTIAELKRTLELLDEKRPKNTTQQQMPLGSSKPSHMLSNFIFSLTHNGLVAMGLEKYLGKLTNSESDLAAALGVTGEFMLGMGPEDRVFDETHAITRSLADSFMTTCAIRRYTKKVYDNAIYGKEMKDFLGVGLDPLSPGELGPLSAAIQDGGYSTAQFTGSVRYRITKEGTDYHFEVTNTTSLESLWYHLPGFGKPLRSELKMGGNVHQTFRFKMSIKEFNHRSGTFFRN